LKQRRIGNRSGVCTRNASFEEVGYAQAGFWIGRTGSTPNQAENLNLLIRLATGDVKRRRSGGWTCAGWVRPSRASGGFRRASSCGSTEKFVPGCRPAMRTDPRRGGWLQRERGPERHCPASGPLHVTTKNPRLLQCGHRAVGSRLRWPPTFKGGRALPVGRRLGPTQPLSRKTLEWPVNIVRAHDGELDGR